MKNWVTLTRTGRDVRSITEWVCAHCPSYITNDYGVRRGRKDAMQRGDDPYTVDYFFGVGKQGQQDMTLFILKWL